MKNNNIKIHRIKCGNGNCCIIEQNNNAILVDTGKIEFQNQIQDSINKFSIKLIVLTHGHFDHCENAGYFSRLFNVPIAMNKKDINCGKAGVIIGDALMNMFYPTISILYGNRGLVLQSAQKITKLGDVPIYFGHGKCVKNREWHN